MRIGAATVNQTPFDWAGNLARIRAAIAEASLDQVEILCFPEMTITGYGCEDWFLSDWVNEKAIQLLLSLLPYCTHGVVCVGLPVRVGTKIYNGMAVIIHQKMEGIVLKQFLPRDGVYYEPRWFSAWEPGHTDSIQIGEQAIPVGDILFSFKGIRFGFEICEDAWQDEQRPGYRHKQRGVDIIFNPSASHYAMKKNHQREAIAVEGSKHFDCVYVLVNALGNEAGHLIYDGNMLVAQQGVVLSSSDLLPFKAYNMISLDINFEHPSINRETHPAPTIPIYEEFTRAAVLALYDYLRKSKAKGFVLNLSGGADSSCCAVLVSEMVCRAIKSIGPQLFCDSLGIPMKSTYRDIIHQILCCLYQPTKNSSAQICQAAQTLATSLGAEFHICPVEDEVVAYERKIESIIERRLTWETDDIARQNIQARVRGPLAWMLANIKNRLLLVTCNRSEADIGYATMDGDTCGSLAPLAGVDKCFILEWLKWAETSLGYSALRDVNLLIPTAELRPPHLDQTDEQDNMPYEQLLDIEREAIFHRLSPGATYRVLREKYEDTSLKKNIKLFYQKWIQNQWKRDRIPLSFHFDDWSVAFRGWCRFPTLSGDLSDELKSLED